MVGVETKKSRNLSFFYKRLTFYVNDVKIKKYEITFYKCIKFFNS